MYAFDFTTNPANTRIVVGMSGGVDSAVTAALLADAGYQVIGVTLELYAAGDSARRRGACCAGRDAEDAAAVASHLGIPHYVLDYRERFRQGVIEPFAASYAAGETPVPCIACNQTVKFADLLATARDLGAAALATGHYVRRVIGEAGPELHRATDLARDQSYFLFGTTPEQLDFLRFPLGGIGKDETRRLAQTFGLPVADKPDSQDICFVASGRYGDIVRRLKPEADRPGDIVDRDGRMLGRHDGIVNFTVGQRRGLGLGGNERPLYVVGLDAEANRVIVGSAAELAPAAIPIRDMVFLDQGLRDCDRRPVTVKLRSTQPPLPATLTVDGTSGTLTPLEPATQGAAPGQAAVIYAGERVLGGGWIARSRIAESRLSAA